jgi:spore maturation protein CgeB
MGVNYKGMRILLVMMLYDYGIKERGFNTEYYNLYLCLKKIGKEVILFDYMNRMQEAGREKMNEELLQIVLDKKPDLVLVSLYTDQFMPNIFDEIKKHTITAYYAYDDMWRSEYVDFWAPHFSYVITSYINGVQSLYSRGHSNGIYLSFGCNHYIFVKKNLPKKYDISFIGMKHPYREWLIHWIEKSGIRVHCWGTGWKNGFVSLEEMINIINQSRINLNSPNETSWDIRYLLSSPRAIRDTLQSKKHFAPVNLRVFEINCCGGFQLLPYMEGLEKRYDIGRELVIFQSPEQLVNRVHYYLEKESERERIAENGYLRTLRDHTMEHRFNELFKTLGLVR